MNTYFVGWLSMAAREHLLVPPEAPANYKDPAAIEKYKRQALDKLMGEAAFMPVVASLIKVSVYDLQRNVIFSASSGLGKLAEVSTDFLRWLTAEETEFSILYGFALDDLLAVAAVETLAMGPPMSLPYSDWHDPAFIKNPYHMLVPSECRKKVDLASFTRFFLGREFHWPEFTDPACQARLAMDLAIKGQLPGTRLFSVR